MVMMKNALNYIPCPAGWQGEMWDYKVGVVDALISDADGTLSP
jgi:hypothetical protein